MKLLKKLLPIATIASTAAVVAPMVTSCSVAGTSDFDYKPTEKHAADSFAVTDAKYAELVKDYFSKSSRLAQDAVAMFASQAKTRKAELQANVESKKIESFEISFNVKVNSIAIKDAKTLKLPTYGDVPGYVIDADLTFTNHEKQVKPENTEEHTKITLIEDESVNVKLTNVFAVIKPGEKGSVSIAFAQHKDLDWKTVSSGNSKTTTETLDTKHNTKTVSVRTNQGEQIEEKSDYPEEIEFFYITVISYYLSDVAITL